MQVGSASECREGRAVTEAGAESCKRPGFSERDKTDSVKAGGCQGSLLPPDLSLSPLLTCELVPTGLNQASVCAMPHPLTSPALGVVSCASLVAVDERQHHGGRDGASSCGGLNSSGPMD